MNEEQMLLRWEVTLTSVLYAYRELFCNRYNTYHPTSCIQQDCAQWQSCGTEMSFNGNVLGYLQKTPSAKLNKPHW